MKDDEIRKSFEETERFKLWGKHVKYFDKGGFYEGITSTDEDHYIARRLNDMLYGFEVCYKSRDKQITELEEQNGLIAMANRIQKCKVAELEERLKGALLLADLAITNLNKYTLMHTFNDELLALSTIKDKESV